MIDLLLEDRHLNILINVLKNTCPTVTVVVFGSRVKGLAHEGSDLDLAVLDWGEQKPDLSALRAGIEQSSLPFLVDIVDFKKSPEAFQAEILKQNVVIYSGGKN